jgi:hypothetical protein
MSVRPLHDRHPRPEPRPVSTVAGALWQEYATIHQESHEGAAGIEHEASLRAYYTAALERNQSALCLSGGGIRSAAFSLGVLQALAQQGLLTSFDYLSTVSGGGYAGGWLAAMLRAHDGDAIKVQGLLKADEPPPELRALRGYTNFLSPHPGISSPDTWAGIVLWVRNVLVNWLIFFPALFALALLPVAYADILAALSGGWWSWPLLLLALFCLGAGVYNGAVHLPSHAFPEAAERGSRTAFVPKRVVWPLIAWAALVPMVAAPWLRPVMPGNAILGDVIPVLGFVVMELAYVLAALHEAGEDRTLFWHNFGWWTLASLCATAMLWLALDFGIGLSFELIAVLGPLAVTLAHLVQSLIYVALRSEAFRGDLDREWLARLNGEKVLPALLWAIFAAVCLLLPCLVLDHTSSFTAFLVSAFGLLTGPAAAYLGKISRDVSREGSSDKGRSGFALPLNILLAIAAAIFAVLLFLLLARLGTTLARHHWLADLVIIAIAALLAAGLGKRINVNRFSMHAVYRSRLVRGFLGSARKQRTPDGFTDIDPRDNPRMADLAAHSGARRVLFPVVNLTLNLTAVRNTAWTERKGESFTVTPCASGAAFLHKSEDVAAGLPARGAYVRTALYAGNEREIGRHDPANGVTLGTALTLSGAAASPSMGYHSSPGAAFLMTLFNVRLGAWLPNPATASTQELARAKPPNALFTLGRELLGLSDDRTDAVYLSDGGHFENLGIYEMVRRRCRRIVVVDAGADPNAGFEDLGNAVRKIRIDLAIEIRFNPPVGIGSRSNPLKPFRSFACATIHYPDSAVMGQLIYLKAADPPDVPMDVRAYRNGHDDFPHQSTANQFFSESQFESYRMLGLSEALGLAGGATTLDDLFRIANEPPPMSAP